MTCRHIFLQATHLTFWLQFIMRYLQKSIHKTSAEMISLWFNQLHRPTISLFFCHDFAFKSEKNYADEKKKLNWMSKNLVVVKYKTWYATYIIVVSLLVIWKKNCINSTALLHNMVTSSSLILQRVEHVDNFCWNAKSATLWVFLGGKYLTTMVNIQVHMKTYVFMYNLIIGEASHTGSENTALATVPRSC